MHLLHIIIKSEFIVFLFDIFAPLITIDFVRTGASMGGSFIPRPGKSNCPPPPLRSLKRMVPSHYTPRPSGNRHLFTYQKFAFVLKF